jgi:Zn-dependent protease/predicted transcriptional regulator
VLPSSGFKIGRIFGIEIVINFTWLFIFVLVGLSLGAIFKTPAQVFPTTLLANYLGRHPFPGGPWPWIAGFVTAAVFFACLLAHELSHSYVAKRSGVSISRITLFMFGGVAEMSEDVRSAGGEFRMAIAGPLATFVLAGVFLLLYWLAESLGAGSLLVVPLLYLFFINLAVGIFNLLPGFPLDGGRVLRSLIWKATGDLKRSTRIASVCGQVLAVGIATVGVVFLFTGNVVGGFWFVLISIFIYRLAQTSYQQTLFRLATMDTRVRDLMHTDIPTVDASVPLTSLRNNYFAAYSLPAFPVTRDGEAVGLVFKDDLSRVSLAEWDVLNAGRIARPLESINVVSPDTPLERIMKRLMRGEEFLTVVEGNQVVGMLTRDELLRHIDGRMRAQGE